MTASPATAVMLDAREMLILDDCVVSSSPPWPLYARRMYLPLTEDALARLGMAMRTQLLGEELFPLVEELQPRLAPWITSILLEKDDAKVLKAMGSEVQLRSEVDEVLRVLEETWVFERTLDIRGLRHPSSPV